MNRRSFLRFLGVSPALSVVDMVEVLERQPIFIPIILEYRMIKMTTTAWRYLLEDIRMRMIITDIDLFSAVLTVADFNQFPPDSGRNLK